jgi:hypothetical protein
MAKSGGEPFSKARHSVERAGGGRVADQVAERLIEDGAASNETDAYSLATDSRPERTGGRVTTGRRGR